MALASCGVGVGCGLGWLLGLGLPLPAGAEPAWVPGHAHPALLLPARQGPAAAGAGLLLPVSRTNYHGRCELPKAAWSEEALRLREAAVRECKENTVRLGYDRHAVVETEAQDRFQDLLEARQSLLQRARDANR